MFIHSLFLFKHLGSALSSAISFFVQRVSSVVALGLCRSSQLGQLSPRSIFLRLGSPLSSLYQAMDAVDAPLNLDEIHRETRSVRAYWFPQHHQNPQFVTMTTNRFALHAGFDIPTLSPFRSADTQTISHTVRLDNDTFYKVYVIRNLTNFTPNRSLLRLYGYDIYGDVVVFRRGTRGRTFVNMRGGDKARAVAAVCRCVSTYLSLPVAQPLFRVASPN